MTADIVNLKQVRKRQARSLKTAQATENRAYFGPSKAARKTSEIARTKLERKLDGHRLQTGDDDAS